MNRTNNIKTLSMATGAALALSVIGSSAMAGQSNPFGMTELSAGYSVAAAEGKCGEGKCGGSKAKEAKCGGDKAKAAEGKCGGMEKKAEAKCGEGKCGGNKKAAESKCGGSK
ncbi:MAG TPA: hypothetical protein VIQ03_02240 [Gammaproteobacteria bacterium]